MISKVVIIAERESPKFSALAEFVQGCPSISSKVMGATAGSRLSDFIDALYLSPPFAERWGAKPGIHKAEVLVATKADQRVGFPRFIISGATMTPEEATKWPVIKQITTFLGEVELAVKAHNATTGFPIERLGFRTQNLGVEELSAEEIVGVIRTRILRD
jgi:hypothetical protein